MVFPNLKDNCPHCGRKLKVIEVELFGKKTKVPCYTSCGCEESKLDGVYLDSSQKKYILAGIPKRYIGAEMELDDYPAMVSGGTSLYVYGTNGNGKSRFASCLAKALVDMGIGVFYKEMPALVKDVQGAYGGKQTDVLERASGCDVLILDDLGKERVSADSLYILNLVIDHRYSSMRPTVVTSNFSRGALMTRYAEADMATAEAIVSRLNEDTVAIEFSGEDRRLL